MRFLEISTDRNYETGFTSPRFNELGARFSIDAADPKVSFSFNPTLPLKDFGLRVVKLKIGELHFWFGEILVLVYFWWEESDD